MRSYIIKRLVNMFITFVGVIVFMYFAYLSLPGNYVSTQILSMSHKERVHLEHLLHLDESKSVQFGYWISGVLKGDFGKCFSTGLPVWSFAGPALWNTFSMFILSLICALLFSVPISIITATKPHSITDNFWTIIALIGVSIPPFVIGAILTKLFTFNQIVFQFSIFQKISFSKYANLMNQHVLPFVVITFANIGVFLRYLRSSMLETVNQEYIRTARSKGLSERKVLYKHSLKNAIPPVLTVFGNSFPAMISSLLMVEIVFQYPGLGILMIQSVHDRDYPLVMAFTIMLAVVILIVNFLIDISYALLDPRVRLNK